MEQKYKVITVSAYLDTNKAKRFVVGGVFVLDNQNPNTIITPFQYGIENQMNVEYVRKVGFNHENQKYYMIFNWNKDNHNNIETPDEKTWIQEMDNYLEDWIDWYQGLKEDESQLTKKEKVWEEIKINNFENAPIFDNFDDAIRYANKQAFKLEQIHDIYKNNNQINR